MKRLTLILTRAAIRWIAARASELRARLRPWVRAAYVKIRLPLPALWREVRHALHALRQRLPKPVKRAIRRVGKITAGTVAWGLAAIVGLFIAAHVWLPTLVEKKSDIEIYLAGAIGNPVKLGDLQTFWDGLNPGLRVRDLRVLTVAGEPALQLRAAELSLSWRALLFGQVEINHLTLIEPQLTVERLSAGQLRITGLAADAATADTLPDFSAWLLRQREIVIVDGELQWIDRGAPAGRDMLEQMTIHAVQASIHNDGARHTFSLRALFPDGVCSNCQVSGVIEGNPLLDEAWSGEMRIQGQRLNLPHLPGVVRQHLPKGLSGSVGVVLAGQWQEGRLQSVTGHVRAQDFSVPLGPQQVTLKLRELDTGIRWQADPEHWRLRLEDLRVALSGAPWQAGRVDLDVRADEGRLAIDHVKLGDAAGFVAGWSQASVFRPWLDESRPEGWLHQLRFTWSGPLLSPVTYRLETGVSGATLLSSGKIPGVSSLSGKLVVTPEDGEFRVDSHGGRLDLPQIMHEVIPFARLAGRVHWRRSADDWLVQGSDLELRNADARLDGDVELRLPRDRQQSPVIKLKLSLRDGRGESVDRYFPRVTPERLRAYLRQAIQGGRVTHATAVVQGALRNFPFLDGKGKFEVRAQVKDGTLEFLPGWTPLRDLDVDMRFTGAGMLLTASQGSLRGLQVSRVAVEIEDFHARQVLLTVHGHARGAAADAVQVLHDSEDPRFRPWLLPGMKISGQGVLDLDLRIPLKGQPAMALDGEYRVTGGRLQSDVLPQAIEAVQGMIAFDHNGLQNGKLVARWLGSPLTLRATPAEGGAEIDVRGTVAAGEIPELLGPMWSRQVRGPVPWQLQWLSGANRNWLTFDADLHDVEINLPAPLEKRRGEALALQFRSSGPEGNQLLLDMQAENRASGRFVWRRQDGQWSLQRGRLAVGERLAVLPQQDGLHVSVRLPVLDVDRWWPVLQPGWEASGADSADPLLRRVSLDVATLYFLDRPFGRASLDLTRGRGYWSGTAEGDALAGKGVIAQAGARSEAARAGVQLELERLAIPPASPGAKAGGFDPRRLPPVELRSQSFRYAQYDFGALEFSAEPTFAGWRINKLALQRAETEMQAKGQWTINRQGQQSSRFEVEASSSDLGETLRAFGYGDELVGGKLTLHSSWNWPGAPGDFTLTALNGDATVNLKDGRLPRISPGAGRLFGAFDMRSLTRIFTLDFSTVLAKGLTFDKLHGSLEVESGNAYTRKLEVLVPGADVELRGRIGLANRDLDLQMDVTPRVGSNLAPVIGGTILGGPLVGGAIAVLGGVTGKPFEKTARTEYRVHGFWSDPQVQPVKKPVAAPDEPSP